jgi:hypothetical protein
MGFLSGAGNLLREQQGDCRWAGHMQRPVPGGGG